MNQNKNVKVTMHNWPFVAQTHTMTVPAAQCPHWHGWESIRTSNRNQRKSWLWYWEVAAECDKPASQLIFFLSLFVNAFYLIASPVIQLRQCTLHTAIFSFIPFSLPHPVAHTSRPSWHRVFSHGTAHGGNIKLFQFTLSGKLTEMRSTRIDRFDHDVVICIHRTT